MKKLSPEKEKRLKELFGMLPDHVRKMVVERPDVALSAIQVDRANRKKYYPSIDMVPNIAQEKALRCLGKRHEAYGDYPFITAFCAGNGVGKTAALAGILLPGMCLGPEFVNRTYCNWQYFYDMAKLREKRPVRVRLVCDAKDMSENGSLMQEIRTWIPTAQFKDKTGTFFQTVQIGKTMIDVKTHDMNKVAHAGPTYDAIIFNEPAPENLWEENVSRCRGGGRLLLFLTPLDLGAYLYDRLTSSDLPDGEVYMTEGSIWDNCADIPGTRGNLARFDIDKMIRQWQMNPDELEARVSGKFQHLQGRMFKVYNEDIHVIDPFPLNKSFNLYQIMDPHECKPPFALWVATDPMNNVYVVAEYPDGAWNQITTSDKTIAGFCSDFDFILRGGHSEFPYMAGMKIHYKIGDPNRMNVKYPNTGLTLKQEYAKFDYEYDCNVVDGLEIGFNAIRELLYYDNQKVVSATNSPRLFIFNTCHNTRAALREFSRKKSDASNTYTDSYDKKWECPIACLRYFAVKREQWEPLAASGDREYDDFDEIMYGKKDADAFASSLSMR